MSIAWYTVQTAVATALLVTLVIEYAVKPQLEARKATASIRAAATGCRPGVRQPRPRTGTTACQFPEVR